MDLDIFKVILPNTLYELERNASAVTVNDKEHFV